MQVVNGGLSEIPLNVMQSFDDKCNAVYDVLDIQKSVKSRTSFGGTSPSEVQKDVRIGGEKVRCLSDHLMGLY